VQREFFMNPKNKEYLDRVKKAQNDRDQVALQSLSEEINPIIEQMMEGKAFEYSPEHLKTYQEVGGTPFLDQQYTVFGEVVEGLEVVDKIAAVAKNSERPVDDIAMSVSVIE
jgi:cyclophilin family peptidyl-prolyl cis-trans isomerase